MVTVLILAFMVGLILAGLLMGWPPWAIAIALALLPTLLGLVVLTIRLAPLHALGSSRNVDLTLLDLYGLAIRRVPVRRVIEAHIRMTDLGLRVEARRIIELHQAGGDIDGVVEAIEMMQHAGRSLGWDDAASWSLAGVDVVRAASLVIERRGSAAGVAEFDAACREIASETDPAFPEDPERQ